MLGEKTIKTIENELQGDFAAELRQQGHYLTGALEESISAARSVTDNGLISEISANDYADPLNDGVLAAKIPYDSSQTTGARHSKYIQGLQNYAKLRFGIADDRKALSAAFAIAKTHEKEGMPTAGSYAYSANGYRTESMERVFNGNVASYDSEIENGISNELDDLFDLKTDIII